MKEVKIGTKQLGLTTTEIFIYVFIALIIPAVIYGFYRNNQINTVVAAALELGEEHKVKVEEFFQEQGKMPQTDAEIGLEEFTPVGVLEDITWQAGVIGEPAESTLLNGTLKGVLDLSEFGVRFEEFESGFLLIARVQEDNSIVWDCSADPATPNALPERYLPESCERASDSED